MKKIFAFASTVALAIAANAQVVFYDDFESGTMDKWTATSAATPNPLTIISTNKVPEGGVYSAHLNTSADRMHHNVIADNGGSEVSGYSFFSSYWYDAANSPTRYYNEVRGYAPTTNSVGNGLPNGGTAADGSLAQLFAIGKYNSVTLAGEVYDGTKYQARVTFGSNAGWFNLNGEGTPNRSEGWHKFDIERLPDGTTINFYVDNVLSRTITGAAAQDWDTVIMGGGIGTGVGDAYCDGIFLAVPEPSTIALGLLGGLGLLARRFRK